PLLLYSFHSSRPHPDLHSFPTRRSSDLRLDFPGRQAIRVMPRIAFTSHLERHLACPPAEVTGSTVRAVLEEVFAGNPQLRGYIRSEEHTSELQSRFDLVCRLLLEKKKKN